MKISKIISDFLKKIVIYFAIYLHIFSIQFYSFASAENISPSTLPTAGIVKSGSADISQNNSTMDINQSSSNAIISWNTFDIGSQATVNFNQPSSSSSTLNRVRTTDASRIYGNLNANGNLFFINPNGVLFGNGARVNVEGLVATTMNMADQDFNQQNFNFNSLANSNSSVINYGKINSNYVALISTNVQNKGEINTKTDLALTSGDNAKLAISADGKLSVKISDSTLQNLVENEGTLKSENGQVLIKASAAKSLVEATINSPSQKKKLISENGVLKLVANTGTIEGKDIKIDAGENGRVISSGTIDVSSDNSKAGSIEITGKEISIQSGSNILAKGSEGGGEILIGGDWQGNGDLLQATYTNVEKDTLIDASSTKTGDGGKIVIWSDIKDKDSITNVQGSLKATSVDGTGGDIETSGAVINTDGIKIDASSQKGKGGLWLIDPYNYTIGDSEATTIKNLLNSGTNVSILTSQATSNSLSGSSGGYGDITVNTGLTLTGNNDVTLTLNAARHITLNSGVSYLDTGSGKLSLAFIAGGDITQNTGGDARIHIAGSLSLTTTTYDETVTSSSSTTTNFNYQSSAYSYKVPTGTNSLTYIIYGARGGKGYGSSVNGGSGGKVSGTIKGINANETLTIRTGGAGANGQNSGNDRNRAGRANGGTYNGGKGGDGRYTGGGGGGYTSIQYGNTVIAMAGAGGGSGAYGGHGGHGGSTISAGWSNGGGNGSGAGSAKAGTAGGKNNGNGGSGKNNGSSGSSYSGGQGGSSASKSRKIKVGRYFSYTVKEYLKGGGGGGAGFKGGGGGGGTRKSDGSYYGNAGGGGGGSSFASLTYTENNSFLKGQNFNNGYGSITATTTSSTRSQGTGNIILKGKNWAAGGSNISTQGNLETWGIGYIKNLSVGGDITIDKDPSNFASGLMNVNVSSGSTTTIQNVIDGSGGIKKTGTGTLKLTANNSYEGETQVNNGKLDVFTSNSLGDDTLVLKNATTLFSSSRGQPITISNDVTLAGTPIIDVSFATGTDLILSGEVGGSGKISLKGDTNSRKLRLTNASNPFSGGIDINTAATPKNKPILEIGAAYASGTGTITSYGTADYGNISFLGDYKINNPITTYNSIARIGVNTNANDAALAGAITATGLLTKTGSGVLTLSNNNSSYSGAINVSEGTLYSGERQSAKKVFGTGEITVANGAKVLTNASGNVANSNKLYLNGGTLGISDRTSNTWAGDIVLGAGTTSSIESAIRGTLSLTGAISGAGDVNFNSVSNGGEISIEGTNTYTGNTTIDSNKTIVAVSLSGKLGGSAQNYASNINIGSRGTLSLNHSDARTPNVTFSGIISGAGGITKNRDYTNAIFTGANTFTGALKIENGTLTVGGKGALGANNDNTYAGNISISADAKLHYTSTTAQRLTGTISLGFPLFGGGSPGEITGTAKHTILSSAKLTTITYSEKKAGSSGTDAKKKEQIQKQLPKFNFMAPPPKFMEIRPMNTYKGPDTNTNLGSDMRPGPGLKPAPGSRPETGKPAPDDKGPGPGLELPGPAFAGNRGPGFKGPGGPGGSMMMPAMAKFKAIKFNPRGPGIKTNFKPMVGTTFANFKPVEFKVDPTIANFKIQPFKPVNFGSTGINFKIPEKNIEVPDTNVKMNFEVKLKGGAPLPSWVKFDPDTLQISGKPPEGYQGTLELDLVGTTEDGTQETQNLEFNITD